MAGIPFPAAVFARVLGNDKTALDYLRQIEAVMTRLAALEDDVEVATGFFQIPNGDFLLTPGGDQISLPG
jgi:hypothetical protein